MAENTLQHSAKGTHWDKHGYLYITPSGRYVYPSDVKNGSVKYGDNSYYQVTGKNGKTINTVAARNSVPIKNSSSSTSGSKSSSTSSTASKPKVGANGRTEHFTPEMAKALGEKDTKEKKTGSSKKSGSKKGTGSKSKKGSSSKSKTKAKETKESKSLGLTEEDLDNMEINTEATNRDEVIKNLALRVIRGDFGDGTERQNRLGKFYGEIQKRVNEMIKERNVVKHSDEDTLVHWGIKRRSGRYRYGSGGRPYQHEDGSHSPRRTTQKQRAGMSNEELQSYIDRNRKEVELHDLERRNMSEGQKFAEDVVKSVGRKVITTAASGALLYAGKVAATKLLNDPELGEYIARGGPKKDKK